ncbi:MAG: tetraprenyl-beta-curcumene synthase family protein [Clostridia bacterium]|nr:tetraprenyl-beta-curcumene synthase family protein [Clostridia bacterium]
MVTVRAWKTVGRLLFLVNPQVQRELEGWRLKAQAMPSPELSAQALASIAGKRFHCQGGSVYATVSSRHRPALVKAIVSLQTISDYLDNLCDRAGVLDEQAFRQLHLAMTDALRLDTPGGVPENYANGWLAPKHPSYYSLYPWQADGGYLQALVATCRQALATLPSYSIVQAQALDLAKLYSELQSLKHLDPNLRGQRLRAWAEAQANRYPDLAWWEWAAATGSTLGLFALMAASSRPGLDRQQASAILEAYFPWICSLHILLDYLIDLEEDREEGDFNFVACYPGDQVRETRLKALVRIAMDKARGLSRAGEDSQFHLTVAQGLLALYLSDPKVRKQGLEPLAKALLDMADPRTKRLWRLCLALRRMGVL